VKIVTPSPILPNVGSGFVGRKAGNDGTKCLARRKQQSRGYLDRQGSSGRRREGIGGFGLSSKEQITPADAVLAEENTNKVHLAFFCSHSYRILTCCV